MWQCWTDFQNYCYDWFRWWQKEDLALRADLNELKKWKVQMTQDVSDLKAAYESNKLETQSAIANLQKKNADLAAQVAAIPGVDPDIVALTKEITDDTAAIHESLNPAT